MFSYVMLVVSCLSHFAATIAAGASLVSTIRLPTSLSAVALAK